MTSDRLSVVIVSFNTCDLLLDCLGSLARYPPAIPFEVIVVDNGSTDNSVEGVRRSFSDVKLIANAANVGFAAANNQGVKETTGNYILLLNSDTRVTEGALDKLISFARDRSDMAAVGPMLLNEDGSWQRSFFGFPNAVKVLINVLGVADMMVRVFRYRLVEALLSRWPVIRFYREDIQQAGEQRVPYVLFACVLLRREVFDEVGLLDESIFLYHEDCEFGYRMARGGKAIWWTPSSKVIHRGGGSSCVVARDAFEHYYRSLVYVFKKHKSKGALLGLKLAIGLGFLMRALLTIFGAYTRLAIPSTYGGGRKSRGKRVGAVVGRVRFYLSMAGFGVRLKGAREAAVRDASSEAVIG